MIDFAPVGPDFVQVAVLLTLLLVRDLDHRGALLRAFFQHFAQLLFHVARLLGQLAHLLGGHHVPLVNAFAGVDVFAATRIRPHVARINAERRWGNFFNDLNNLHLLALCINLRLPSFADAVGNDRAFQHAGAQHRSVVDHLADFAVVVAFHELVIDFSLHGLGALVGHFANRLNHVFLKQRLAVAVNHLLACARIHGRVFALVQPEHDRQRTRLNTPVAIVGWKQDVRQTSLCGVRLLARQANVDGRPVRRRALRRYRVSLLDAGHHLAGCAVDIVSGMVLINVFKPALVGAGRVASADPLVTLAGQISTKGLQAILQLGAEGILVFVDFGF